jgi:hypothetical protein
MNPRQSSQSSESRCTLLIALGTPLASSLYSEKDRAWNADPHNFSLNRLPKIIRPLLDKLSEEGQVSSLINRKSYSETSEYSQFSTDLYAKSACITLSERNYNVGFFDERLAQKIKNQNKTLYEYALTAGGRGDDVQGGFVVIIGIDFSLTRDELYDAIKNGKRIDQALITTIHTNKGPKGHEFAHPTAIEAVFPEVEHLKKHLNEYKKHLAESGQSAQQKIVIVNKMIAVMDDKNIFYQDKLNEITKILNESVVPGITNKAILSDHRDPIGLRILANIGHVLTLGIVSKLTKGTFAFWKAHGEVVAEEIEEAVKNKKH